MVKEEEVGEEVLGGSKIQKPCEKHRSRPRHPQGSEKMPLLKGKRKKQRHFVSGAGL